MVNALYGFTKVTSTFGLYQRVNILTIILTNSGWFKAQIRELMLHLMFHCQKITRLGLIARLLAGLLSSLASGTAFAVSGEPLAFDQYTAADGSITAACGTGGTTNPDGSVTGASWTNPNGNVLAVDCGAPTISDGMLQRQIVVDSLDNTYDGTYVQFVMTESGASGDAAAAHFSTDRGNLYFTNEDFIKMNNRGEGIASKQTILDSSFDNTTFIEDRFSVETEFKIGWAQGNAGAIDPWVDLNQSIERLQYDNTMALATSAVELYNDDIRIISIGPALNNTKVEIDQRTLMLDDKNANDDALQKFKHTRLSGFFTDTASDVHICIPGPAPNCSIVDVFVNDNPLLPGGTNGGVIEWAINEGVSATWVGVDSVDPLVASIDRLFGMTKYQNYSKTTGNIESTLTSFSSAEAGGSLGAWDSVVSINTGLPLFGAAPAMADVGIFSMTDFSVMNASPLLGPANLDYMANSNPTLTSIGSGLTIADTDYNQWTVNNGVFTASCPSFAEACAGVAINEGGFYQRWIKVAGEEYLQTIIIDDGGKAGVLNPTAANYANNSIAFINETFVKKGSGGSGIASNMHMAERGTDTAYLIAGTSVVDMPDTAGDFTQDVTLNLGWANQGTIFVDRDMNGDNVIDPGEGITEPHAGISIEQGQTVQDYLATDAVSMETLFTLERGATDADKRVTMYSRVGTQLGFINPIDFNSVTVSGAYQRTARADIIDPFILPGNSSDLDWSAGDALQATWMAGNYGTNPLVAVTQVESTSFTNRTTGESISYTETQSSPLAPDNWFIDPFLAAPTYP